MPSFESQYEALSRGAGMVDVSDRTQIEITGEDRTTFLHNMCTQDIKKLATGAGCEAFFTDAKGHILAFTNLFVAPSSIILVTVSGQGSVISAHLDKYIIREDVQLAERTSSWRQLLFAGEKASEVLSQLFGSPLPDEPWQHASGTMADREVYVRRVPHAGSTSLAVSCLADDIGALVTAAKSAGVVECESKVLETVRIECGTPYFGCDVTEDNLPQEVDRNCSAISFDKGCYIGQETVARLDALGHVNKLLVGVTFKGSEVPPTGAELRAGERTVGRVTSATFSPKFNAPLALAYVRRGHHEPGSQLASNFGDGEVVRLGM